MRRQQYRLRPSSVSASLSYSQIESLLAQHWITRSCIPITLTILQQLQVFIPFVADDFTARETPDGNKLQGRGLE